MVFLGPAAFNKYAYTLESNPLLPVIEIGAAADLRHPHLQDGADVPRQPAARGRSRYAKKKRAGRTSRKTFASSTMIVSGLWLLVFIVIHVKAFRRTAPSTQWPAGGRDLYRLEMENFANPLMVGFYVLSMVVVGSHLWHGISSAFQSLGVDQPALDAAHPAPPARCIAVADRRRLHRHRRSGRTSRERGHEARRAESRPARSPRSGTGTSSR